jgi:putative methyltransferase (TIGR04325 family)
MIDVARGLRRAARELLPPIVARHLRRGHAVGPGATFGGDYQSFEAARQMLGSEGYEDSGYVSSTLEATREYRARIAADPTRAADARTLQNLAAFLTCLRGVNAETIRVLDFGGGVGLHYYTLAPLLQGTVRASWTVCELPALARAGRDLGGPPELRFIEDLRAIEDERFHVVLASGSLQYVPDPAATWAALAPRADAVIMNRCPFIAASVDRLTVQRVRAIASFGCPAWFFSEPVWRRRFASAGFAPILKWDTPEDTVVLDGTPIVCAGVALRRAAPDAAR